LDEFNIQKKGLKVKKETPQDVTPQKVRENWLKNKDKGGRMD